MSRKSAPAPAPRIAPAKALISVSIDVPAPSNGRPSLPATPSLRGIIDALLQGSLVDLFQAYGVALAPLPRSTRSVSDHDPALCASIDFASATDGKCADIRGRLSLSIPIKVFETLRSDPSSEKQRADWARELVNQLMGRLKNRLLPFGAKLRAGLPTSIDREALEIQLAASINPRVYRARTLRGEVVATLDGTLNESELAYAGPALAAEGELLLF